MRSIFLAAILLAVTGGSISSQEYVPNQVVISFHEESPDAFYFSGGKVCCMYPELLSCLQQYGIREIAEGYHGARGVKNFWLVTFDGPVDVSTLASSLTQYAMVRGASPNYKAHFLSNPNDFYFSHDWWMPVPEDNVRCVDQWDLTLMQADKAWHITKGDPAITVAIMDSGIDYFHPDLRNNIWVNPDEDVNANGAVWDTLDINGEDEDGNGLVDDLIGWDFIRKDNNPFLDTTYTEGRHGTMMASEFASTDNDTAVSDTSMAGLAGGCRIATLKTGNVFEATEALNYAMEKRFDIVNMSLGFWGSDSIFHDAIRLAHSFEMILVAADDAPWFPSYPASWPEVITVGCVDETGTKVVGRGHTTTRISADWDQTTIYSEHRP